MIKKYFLYIIRWQLSTPILYVFVWSLTGVIDAIWITILANFVGALIFFWVDKFIFRKRKSKNPLWEMKEDVKCQDCGKVTRGYRIVEWRGYSRLDDKNPEYRCEECKAKKLLEVEKIVNKNNKCVEPQKAMADEHPKDAAETGEHKESAKK